VSGVKQGKASKSSSLTLRQEKFVQALTTPKTPTYCKPSAAYRVISPLIQPEAQHNGAYRMMRNDEIQSVIKGQLGLGEMGRELKRCLRVAKSVQKSADPSLKLSATRETRDTIMDYAKLTGQLVEKREVKTLTDSDHDAIRQMVHRALILPGSMPTPTHSVMPTLNQSVRKVVDAFNQENGAEAGVSDGKS